VCTIPTHRHGLYPLVIMLVGSCAALTVTSELPTVFVCYVCWFGVVPSRAMLVLAVYYYASYIMHYPPYVLLLSCRHIIIIMAYNIACCALRYVFFTPLQLCERRDVGGREVRDDTTHEAKASCYARQRNRRGHSPQTPRKETPQGGKQPAGEPHPPTRDAGRMC